MESIAVGVKIIIGEEEFLVTKEVSATIRTLEDLFNTNPTKIFYSSDYGIIFYFGDETVDYIYIPKLDPLTYWEITEHYSPTRTVKLI